TNGGSTSADDADDADDDFTPCDGVCQRERNSKASKPAFPQGEERQVFAPLFSYPQTNAGASGASGASFPSFLLRICQLSLVSCQLHEAGAQGAHFQG